MHLVSHVEGRTAARISTPSTPSTRSFPAGTLTGAPKMRAMELIDEFEPVFRGPYGGAVGYFSLVGQRRLRDHDSNAVVAPRRRDGPGRRRRGRGQSARLEYEESINKASAPLLALEIADPSTN